MAIIYIYIYILYGRTVFREPYSGHNFLIYIYIYKIIWVEIWTAVYLTEGYGLPYSTHNVQFGTCKYLPHNIYMIRTNKYYNVDKLSVIIIII